MENKSKNKFDTLEENQSNILEDRVNMLENYIQVMDVETYSRIEKEFKKFHYPSVEASSFLSKNKEVQNQLRTDYIKMVRAKIKDDYPEFCRFAYLQIELLINAFIKVTKENGKIEIIENRDKDKDDLIKVKGTERQYRLNAQGKLSFCLEEIQGALPDLKNKINTIMNVRNVSSHRDLK